MHENVQDGVNDCKEYYVSLDQIKELIDICKRVVDSSNLTEGEVFNGYSYKKDEESGEMIKIEIKEPGLLIEDPKVADQLLPTENGFFFGSTEYNEWYLNDIKYTIEALESLLDYKGAEFYYRSSW